MVGFTELLLSLVTCRDKMGELMFIQPVTVGERDKLTQSCSSGLGNLGTFTEVVGLLSEGLLRMLRSRC